MLVVHSLRIKKKNERFLETGSLKYIYKNELDKACFEHDMDYHFKDLKRRTYADRFLKNEVFKIASNPKYDRY